MSGATAFASVPIVDISSLRSPDRTERERVAAEIGRAAREVGFLYIDFCERDQGRYMIRGDLELFVILALSFHGLTLECIDGAA